ncbi:MAG: ATP-binding protein [Myxococcales bacterium]
MVVARDVTDLRRAQEEQERLMQALREADEQKNSFLAMLSHELRNPLAPIRNSLYILERAAPGGQQAQRAQEVIGRQVQHMTRLIDDLLDVTRISRGKVRLQKERLELCELLRRTAEDHRAVFRAAGVELRVETCAGGLYTAGDPTRLSQAVGNLLGNAVKFTPRGGWVELHLDSDGHRAAIHVRDNGAGIASDLLNKLFQPFVQADVTLDRSKGGLGLGLALVKGLVEMHGGSVSARSEGAGKGAEFILSLPLDEQVAPVRPPPLSSARPEKSALRVLVIEDNVDAAETLKEALELDGHQVETAATGLAGIEKAHALHPDVILCDIGLPEMDGFEVARRLRADPELRSAPLVALSGYAAPEDLERSKLAGFDRHLAKPPDLGALENALEQVSAAARHDALHGAPGTAPPSLS